MRVLFVAMLAASVALPAGAATYLSLAQAVKKFIGDAKAFKVTKTLSTQDRARLAKDYGWESKDADHVFYVGKDGDTPTAYVYLVNEVFNTCFHKYAVGMKPDGEVIDTVVVELSCPRAFPVNRKSFLAQFSGKQHTDALTTRSDVDAVTGATLSSEATAQATRKAVSLHNLFFGGAKEVVLSDAVKKARADAAGVITKAIETGQTLAKKGQPAHAVVEAEEK